MRAADHPIGVFDSGIGGLTVLKALARRMPGENLVYFGDTAHVPYGSKSPQAVTRYSTAVARFLERRGIKALVVACNTSSALALGALKKAVKVPVVGVILPGARAAAATGAARVGVIGTEATVASGAYQRALKSLAPSARVTARACPLFVPLVEEGWISHPVSRAVAREYLAGLKGVGVLILGCTHYPVLKPVIRSVMGPSVRLVDSAEQTAIEVEDLLDSLKLRRRVQVGRREFFVSDAPARFLKVARRVGVPVQSVSLHPFDA